MLKIYALPLNPGNKVRRKFMRCPRCGHKNWFSYGAPLMCINSYCGLEFHFTEGLLDGKEKAVVHYYKRGIA